MVKTLYYLFTVEIWCITRRKFRNWRALTVYKKSTMINDNIMWKCYITTWSVCKPFLLHCTYRKTHIHHNIYCDLIRDKETSTECSEYTGTNGQFDFIIELVYYYYYYCIIGNLIFYPTNMHVHGLTVAENSMCKWHT